MKKRILLLGVGFLGYSIADALSDVYEVFLADSRPGRGVRFQVDLLDSNAISRLIDLVSPSVIINTVSLASYFRCHQQPELSYSLNIVANRNALSLARRLGLACYVLRSNYSVFYTQGITSFAEEGLKNGGSQIVVENGQVIKICKDKDGLLNPREILTKNWHDWVDYWSIDFDFTNRKEIVRIKDEKTGEFSEKWTGDYIFENEWQSFRTRQNPL